MDEDKFWRNVAVAQGDGCWPYVGRGSRGRYGHVRITFGGRREYAHRVAFRLSGGVLTEELRIVRHACDQGDCCRPGCLLSGTPADNVRDRDERGRRTPNLPLGVEHWSAKLDEARLRAVRVARAEGLDARVVAKMFDVSAATIYNIWAGRHYSGRAA